MDTIAVRAYPGRSVTDTPLIFSKTLRADLKTANAAPAKGLFFFAAMTAIVFPSCTTFFCFVFPRHFFIKFKVYLSGGPCT